MSLFCYSRILSFTFPCDESFRFFNKSQSRYLDKIFIINYQGHCISFCLQISPIRIPSSSYQTRLSYQLLRVIRQLPKFRFSSAIFLCTPANERRDRHRDPITARDKSKNRSVKTRELLLLLYIAEE